jgi:hypothetical protein
VLSNVTIRSLGIELVDSAYAVRITLRIERSLIADEDLQYHARPAAAHPRTRLTFQ